MRILIVSSTFPPELGTTPLYVSDVARGLAGRGHQVHALVPTPRPYATAATADADLAAPNLQVERVRLVGPRRPTLMGRAWEWGLASLLLPFRAAMRGRPDAVIVFSPPLPLAARIVRRFRKRARVIVNLQDLYPKTAADVGILHDPVSQNFFGRMERRMYERAAAIIVDSESNASHVRQRGGKDVRIIESWSTVRAIGDRPRENEFRRRHGLEGKFVVSYAGVFSPHQGLEVVLDAAAQMRDEADIVFLMVGDGMQKEALVRASRERALPNVKFLPYVPSTEYEELLAASDVCLVVLAATVLTAVPGKIYSIMGAARPIIAVAPLEGNVPPVIARSQAGVCVAPGNVQGFAAAIQRMRADLTHRRQLGLNGLRYVTTTATLQRAVTEYEAILATQKGSGPDRARRSIPTHG